MGGFRLATPLAAQPDPWNAFVVLARFFVRVGCPSSLLKAPPDLPGASRTRVCRVDSSPNGPVCSKETRRHCKTTGFSLLFAVRQHPPKTHRTCPKSAPRRSQDTPRRPQDGPRRPRTRPRRFQDAPRRTQYAPRHLQEAPKTPQDAPNTPLGAPRRHPRRLKTPQGAP